VWSKLSEPHDVLRTAYIYPYIKTQRLLNVVLVCFSYYIKLTVQGDLPIVLKKHLALEIYEQVVLVLVEVLIVMDCRGSWVWDAGGLNRW